jgi:hypothetical protein
MLLVVVPLSLIGAVCYWNFALKGGENAIVLEGDPKAKVRST